MRFPKPLALVLLLPALAGCWSYTAAHPLAIATPTPLPADAWPSRDAKAVRPILDSTPHEVFGYRVLDGVDPATLSDSERKMVEQPQYIVTYKGMHADSLLRIYDEPSDDADKIHISIGTRHVEHVSFSDVMNDLFLGFSPNAHMMSSRTLAEGQQHAQLEAKLTPPPDPDASSLSIIRTKVPAPKIEAVESAHLLHIQDGLPIRIPPVQPGAKKPRGLIIHLHAIAGNPYEPQVIQEFTRRGWAVIDIKTESELDSPVAESSYPEIIRLEVESRELTHKIYAPIVKDERPDTPENFNAVRRRVESNPLYPRLVEVSRRLAVLRDGSFQVCSDADLDGVAAAIAREIDDGLAGAAYATQAVLEYVKEERPDLQGIPIVLMGFSAGALATPTVAARVHDQLDAVVIIGGGCDLLRISQNSVFTDGGLKIRCGDKKISKAAMDRLDELYLKDSRLDPYHTAPLITDLPVLQLHASSDTWVPYASGELLYERLNHPDRLTMHGGHEYLFYFLPNRKSWIADWVEKAVASRRHKS